MQPTRLAILKAVQKLSLTGWPPSRREIGKAIGQSSTGCINYHIDRLEQYGYVKRRPGRVGVLMTKEGIETIALSLLPLTIRTRIARNLWDAQLEGIWRQALNDAKHGLFEIKETENECQGI